MKKRVRGHLYFLQDIRRVNGQYRYVGTSDGTLFSANYGRTKLYASELPEWFVYGRFYKRFGYLSTKGIKAIRYVPSWHTHHFLKDDHLQISYDKTESELGDYWDDTTWVWGNEILDVLQGAKIYSNYNIDPIVCQIKEKIEWLRKTQPEQFSEAEWKFDIEKHMQQPFKNGLPPKYVAVSLKSCLGNDTTESLYGSEEKLTSFIDSLPSNYEKTKEENHRELLFIKDSFDYIEGFELESVDSKGEPYELQFYSSLLSQLILRNGDRFELCASAEVLRLKYRKKGCQNWTDFKGMNNNVFVEKANPEGTDYKTSGFILVKSYDSAKDAVSEMWNLILSMETVVKYIFGARADE